MNKEEFLNRMQEALEGEISSDLIRSNLQYYRSYIMDEMRGGRTEAEVLEELGDPRLIAHTIIDSQDAAEGNYGREHFPEVDYSYSEGSETSEPEEAGRGLWARIRPVVIIGGILVIALLVLSTIFTVLAVVLSSPIFWTVFAIVALWRIFTH